jgi:hypothetical protein
MKKRSQRIWIPAAISLAGGVIVLSMRLWNRRFVSADIQPILLEVDGELKQGRRVSVQSIFNLSPEETWRRVQTPSLLEQVAHPVIRFHRQDGRELPLSFHENQTIDLRLKALGFIPLGKHTITIQSVDPERREILSHEQGQIAQVWRHLISVRPYGKSQTLYTDQVDLYAGRQTQAAAAFARLFYMYRQTRWQQLTAEEPYGDRQDLA